MPHRKLTLIGRSVAPSGHRGQRNGLAAALRALLRRDLLLLLQEERAGGRSGEDWRDGLGLSAVQLQGLRQEECTL